MVRRTTTLRAPRRTLVVLLGALALGASALAAVACGADAAPTDAAPPASAEPAATSKPNTEQALPAVETAPETAAENDENAAEPEPEPSPDPPAKSDADAPTAKLPADDLIAPLPYDNDHALAALRTLAVEIGARPRGSAAINAAADFLAETFASFGYDVWRQEFTLPLFRIEALEVAAAGMPITANALAGTAGGLADGPLVAIAGLGTEADFAAVDVDGAIALVERGILFFQEKIDNAEAAGAIGVIIYNNEPGPFQGSLDPGSDVPAVAVSQADGRALRDLTDADRVTARIMIEGGLTADVAENIIASSGSAPCRIYVGGHYDSVPNIAGANDNASGAALVLELARAFAGSTDAELVCFAGFAAEEAVGGIEGLEGSYALVAELAQTDALAQVTAMLNLDVVAAGDEVALIGDAELVDLTRAIAAAIGVETTGDRLPLGSGSDHFNFAAAGVPVIFPTALGGPIHSPDDNFAIVDPALVNEIGRLAHATLRCLIVRAGGRLPPPEGCTTAEGG